MEMKAIQTNMLANIIIWTGFSALGWPVTCKICCPCQIVLRDVPLEPQNSNKCAKSHLKFNLKSWATLGYLQKPIIYRHAIIMLYLLLHARHHKHAQHLVSHLP